MDHDFDALVEQSRNASNKLGEQALWRAAVNLDAWYFVARGPGEDVEPMVGALDGRPYLLVFTDDARAADFGKRRTMRQSGARGSARDPASLESTVLDMEVPDAVDYCRQLAAAGVEGVLFNSGGYAFQCSIPELLDRRSRYGAKG